MKKVYEQSLGDFTAKIYKDTEWKEFQVKFYRGGISLGEEATSFIPYDPYDKDYAAEDLEEAKNIAGIELKRYQNALI